MRCLVYNCDALFNPANCSRCTEHSRPVTDYPLQMSATGLVRFCGIYSAVTPNRTVILDSDDEIKGSSTLRLSPSGEDCEESISAENNWNRVGVCTVHTLFHNNMISGINSIALSLSHKY